MPNKWYENVPVVNTDGGAIMWEKGVFTDPTISANHLDIIVHNKKDKLCLLTNIADHNIMKRENDKLTKYKSLGIDIRRSWNMRAQIVSIVIEA